MAIGPSTKLQAVNDILRGVGVGTVTALSGSVDATVVEGMLDRATDMLLERGWYFNIDSEFYIVPSARNWVHLPVDVLRADPVNKTRRAVERGVGRRLYDIRNRTYEWTSGPTNLLSDPFDFDTSNWSRSNLTVVIHVEPDPLGTDLADRATQTSAVSLGKISQDVAKANLTDESTYDIGVYVFPKTGGDEFIIKADHRGGGTDYGSAEFDLTKGTITATEGHAKEAKITPTGHGTYFCSFRQVFDFALYGGTDARVEFQPSKTVADQDVVGLWGAHLKEVGETGEKLSAVLSFSDNPAEDDDNGAFGSIPPTPRTFITAKVMRQFAAKVVGDPALMQDLRQDELGAWVQLLRADSEYNDANMLTDSLSVSSILGSGVRRSPLTGAGGGSLAGMSTE